ncbi:MAG: hypothetical protein EXS10_09820 [Phycisphaerales bacterium]|nr:hypothetical protein [Phycisphaerales bacterium]
MASARSAWGIEIGSFALKAIRLERTGDEARIADFAVIPHRKVLTTPDLDVDEMIRLSLGQFMSERVLEKQMVVLSIPGNQAFARFTKLPPVEPKQVANIVRFEAQQQIPFQMEDVEWDYQTFESADSPEIEVGIFAIQKDRLDQRLSLYADVGIGAQKVTLGPVGAYNGLAYDLGLTDASEPVVILDIGTLATDLIVAHGNRCWIRTFPLGGTHFTEAIAEAFQVSYSKAEELKRDGATSKYAKQMMQSMRTVFGDLLGDVQKSLVYYQQLNRGVQLKTVLGLGSTFKIPGLRKFLGQQLNLEVLRYDEFRRIRIEGERGADLSAATINLATAYGLALQGIGLAPIDVNLAPTAVLRRQLWQAKNRWFAAAAALGVGAGALMFARGLSDQAAVAANQDAVNAADTVIRAGKNQQDALKSKESDSNVGFRATNAQRLLDDREIWPCILNDVAGAIDNATDDAYQGATWTKELGDTPASQRQQVELLGLSGRYGVTNSKRTVEVTMSLEFASSDPQSFIDNKIVNFLKDAERAQNPNSPYKIVAVKYDSGKDEKIIVGAVSKPEDGDGTSAGSSSASTGPRFESANMKDAEGNDINSGGSGSGSSFGGVKGKRSPAGNKVAAPKGRLSGTHDGGGTTPETEQPDYGPRGEDGDASGGNKIDRGAGATAEGAASLDALAPLPTRPMMFPAGSEIYLARVVFVVEINGDVQVSGAESAPVEGGQ